MTSRAWPKLWTHSCLLSFDDFEDSWDVWVNRRCWLFLPKGAFLGSVSQELISQLGDGFRTPSCRASPFYCFWALLSELLPGVKRYRSSWYSFLDPDQSLLICSKLWYKYLPQAYSWGLLLASGRLLCLFSTAPSGMPLEKWKSYPVRSSSGWFRK